MVHQSRLLLQLLPEPALGAADWPRPADASVCRRGWKRLEADGVGLAIVAALDRRSGENPANVIVSTASSRATSPISIATPSWTSNGSSGRFAAAVCASGSSRAREMDFCSPAIDGEFGGFQVADFLSRCHLCRKKLHGKDIYMYKGEKAFCSMECRYQQIISDECQENCGPEASRPEASRPAEVSSSPYSGGKIFFPGIVVS